MVTTSLLLTKVDVVQLKDMAPPIGYKHTKEAKRKIGLAAKGKRHLLGRIMPLAQRLNISKALKGKNVWSKGRKLSEKTKNKIRMNANPLHGENHPYWKGDDVGYQGLHRWVRKKLGEPHYCEHCKRSDLKHRQYNWANISGKYKREVSDWIRLCMKCHFAYDKLKDNIKQYE